MRRNEAVSAQQISKDAYICQFCLSPLAALGTRNALLQDYLVVVCVYPEDRRLAQSIGKSRCLVSEWKESSRKESEGFVEGENLRWVGKTSVPV